MTDNELLSAISNMLDDKLKTELQPIKSDIVGIKDDIIGVKSDIISIKKKQMTATAELKAMDKMILDEVERVHLILNQHTGDKTIHTA